MSDPATPAHVLAKRIPPGDHVPGVILIATALVASLLGFGWTLSGYFVGDDFAYVGRYFDFPFAEWPHLFVHGWADDLWPVTLRELRPLNALAFMLDARAWGLNPTGFRLTNVMLHAASATLVGLIAWRVAGRQRAVAIAACVLFAVHPVQSNAVPWISGRVDLLSTFFFLCAFLAFLNYRTDGGRRWLVALVVSHLAALFVKEAGVILPLMFLTADAMWLRPTPRWREPKVWAPYVSCGAVLLVYFVCRRLAFGIGGPAGIGRGLPDPLNALSYLELLRREAAYCAHLLPPLQPWLVEWRDTGIQSVPRTLGKGIAIVIALAAAAWVLRRWWQTNLGRSESRAAIFFALGWGLVATVPLMATYFSARHLYLAACGFSIALALVLRGAFRGTAPYFAITAILAAFFGQQLVMALRPWHDAAHLSREIVREVKLAQHDLPRGSALVFDVPDILGVAFCWSWANPHALRPPFASERLDERFVVVESPDTSAFGNWRRQTSILGLTKAVNEIRLIHADRKSGAHHITIPADRYRTAVEQYLTATKRTPPDEAWQDFIAEIGRP